MPPKEPIDCVLASNLVALSTFCEWISTFSFVCPWIPSSTYLSYSISLILLDLALFSDPSPYFIGLSIPQFVAFGPIGPFTTTGGIGDLETSKIISFQTSVIWPFLSRWLSNFLWNFMKSFQRCTRNQRWAFLNIFIPSAHNWQLHPPRYRNF